jgi:hypothetical protein
LYLTPSLPILDQDHGGRDIALSRAGTWQHKLSEVFADTDYSYAVRKFERWRIVPGDYANVGDPGGDTQWPDADGDILVLERVEKSMHLVYWTNKSLHAKKVYRYVEP